MKATAIFVSKAARLTIRPAAHPVLNRRELIWMAVLTCLTLALRAADMMGRSLWLDEGWTLLRLNSSWLDNLRNTIYLHNVLLIDVHPPLYFLILKTWVIFAGQSEFALKWVSALAGALVVPLSYALARRLFAPPVALLTAVTMSLSPAIQWYSHEIRMYTLVVVLSTSTTYALSRLIKPKPTARWMQRRLHTWITWGILTFSSISTHFSLAGLALTHLLFIGIMLLPRMSLEDKAARQRFIRWLAIAGILVAALCAAIFPFAQATLVRLLTGQEKDNVFVPLDVIFSSIVTGHTFGMNATDPTGGLATWGFIALCLVGVLVPWSGDRGRFLDRLLLGLSAVGPVLIWFALSFIKPNFQGIRHLILVLPLIAIMLSRAMTLALDAGRRHLLAGHYARGWAWIAISIAGIAALLMAQGYGNLRQFERTSNWHDDWRSLAYYVRDHWQEGDIVLGSPPEVAVISLYAHDLQRAVLPAPDEAQRFRRVWLTNPTYYDWLSERGFHRGRIRFPARTRVIELDLFELQSPLYNQLPTSARPLPQATSPGSPALVGYELKPGNQHNPQPNLWLSLYWKHFGRSDAGDYSVSLRLSDTNGRVWHDWSVPAGFRAAPDALSADLIFRVDHIIPIPLGLPFQAYRLQLATRAGPKAEVVQTVEVDLTPEEVHCCVRVSRWPAVSTGLPVWQGDGVKLLKAEYKPTMYVGDILPVVLTWQLDKPISRPWRTVLSFSGLLGGSVVTATGITGGGLTPISTWPVGEPVRDMQSLVLPFTACAGFYLLSMEMRADDERVIDRAHLGIVEVRDYPHAPVATNIPHRVNAQVGELKLLGYGLSQPFTRATPLDLYTYWQVESNVTRDGVLFVHVIGPDGHLAAQDDNPPEYGKRSTLTYRPGDGIEQLHRLVLPFTAPGGEYKLYAGVYSRNDMVRWPAFRDGAPARDDLVYLSSFYLPPLNMLYLPALRREGD